MFRGFLSTEWFLEGHNKVESTRKGIEILLESYMLARANGGCCCVSACVEIPLTHHTFFCLLMGLC